MIAAAVGSEEVTSSVLRALAAPSRRVVLRLVRDRELPAGEIAAEFDSSRTAISQHLAVLKQAGLISERRNGTQRLYRARPEGLTVLRSLLDDMWSSSLDSARRLVEVDKKRSPR